jgi:hypothetical protein
MKRPILSEFERWVMINKPKSLFVATLELRIEVLKLKRELSKCYVVTVLKKFLETNK